MPHTVGGDSLEPGFFFLIIKVLPVRLLGEAEVVLLSACECFGEGVEFGSVIENISCLGHLGVPLSLFGKTIISHILIIAITKYRLMPGNIIRRIPSNIPQKKGAIPKYRPLSYALTELMMSSMGPPVIR